MFLNSLKIIDKKLYCYNDDCDNRYFPLQKRIDKKRFTQCGDDDVVAVDDDDDDDRFSVKCHSISGKCRHHHHQLYHKVTFFLKRESTKLV